MPLTEKSKSLWVLLWVFLWVFTINAAGATSLSTWRPCDGTALQDDTMRAEANRHLTLSHLPPGVDMRTYPCPVVGHLSPMNRKG